MPTNEATAEMAAPTVEERLVATEEAVTGALLAVNRLNADLILMRQTLQGMASFLQEIVTNREVRRAAAFAGRRGSKPGRGRV